MAVRCFNVIRKRVIMQRSQLVFLSFDRRSNPDKKSRNARDRNCSACLAARMHNHVFYGIIL